MSRGIFIGPTPDPEVEELVRRHGATVTSLEEASGVVWVSTNPKTFVSSLPDTVEWVQVPIAGVDGWFSLGLFDDKRTWTTAVGAYADAVAEHALMLLLAGVRSLRPSLLADRWLKDEIGPTIGTIRGATIAVVGAGAIGRSLIPALLALGADVIAVNRSGEPVEGARETLPSSRLAEVWPRADHVILAAPGTPETAHMVGSAELAAMRSHAWLVNVGRGTLIDQAALVAALDRGEIAGAALDVFETEPLPENDPLWQSDRVILTPHVANPPHALRAAFLRRLDVNVPRFLAGEPLLGVLDLKKGY